MARDQRTTKQGVTWIPVIIGLILGVTVAAMTDQWWWATVGALIGAAAGAIGAYSRRGSADP